MEWLDIVDDRNTVIGKATIEDVYARKLPHRIAHVLIFNAEGRIALQKSSTHKKFCPQHWGTPVGGHVQSGESYEQAARRECMEELGVDIAVKQLWTDVYVYEDRNLKKFLGVFRGFHEGPFKLNPQEVEDARFFSLAEIRQMIENGEPFHPELLFILEREFGIKKAVGY